MPQVTHTPESTLRALQQFREHGGRVVLLGECLGRDEYGHERRGGFPGGVTLSVPPTAEELWRTFEARLADWGVERQVRLQTPTGEPVWGVEYLAAEQQDCILVNLCNYLREPQSVRLLVNGQPVSGTDLLTGTQVGPEITVPSLRPMLVAVKAG